jgi:hypothetical protein
VTRDTSVQGRKSSESTALVKLSRMLRNMLRSYPRAHLLNTVGAFGVSLDERTCMQVSYSGNWTDADMRDCLALFATWWVADPARLRSVGAPLVGVSREVIAELEQSASREDSNGQP